LTRIAWQRWLPWDDGMLAQAAHRLLGGELPHRDFDEVYTGGLTWVHAAAFRLSGESLWTVRATLFVATSVSIPVWYFVARRFVESSVAAGLLTLTWFLWSVPNYVASMPSWYNLFFAMGALAAALRFIDTSRRRWVFVAGMCAGLSISVKISGVFLLVGLIGFIIFEGVRDDRGFPINRSQASGWLLPLAVGLVGLAPIPLLRSNPIGSAFILLGLPPLVLFAALCMLGIRAAHSGVELTQPIRNLSILAAGAAFPLVLLCLPYIHAHALASLVRGVFVLPQKRLSTASMQIPVPGLFALVFTVPVLVLLTVARYSNSVRRLELGLLIAAWAALDALTVRSPLTAAGVWLSIRMLMPGLACISAALIVRRRPTSEQGRAAIRRLVLVSCVAAWCSLIQFPFAAPIYFSFVAPLVMLAGVALADVTHLPSRGQKYVFLCGYLLFALLFRDTVYPGRPHDVPLSPLAMPRGGIWVPSSDSAQYAEIVSLLRQHSTSPYTLAFPDAPEIYFLSGLANPTRDFYDAFESPSDRTRSILQRVDVHAIHAVALNRTPKFSPAISGDLRDSLISRFPESKTVGHYEIRWSAP
jgi:hypothetical protein